MKLVITCKCPECGNEVKISKALAGRVLQQGRKQPSKEDRQKWGKKGAIKRWRSKTI
jgi:hypothetical protein